jgi:exodeoxyribonuclease VII large subunit
VTSRPPLTVSQLTATVRGALSAEPELEDVLVEGEVSNLAMPVSGHLYFTLKDRAASIRCVCWRSARERIPFHPENGMTVIAHGRVDVYDADGAYQLYVDSLDPSGRGALALAVEQLTRRLFAEGLFDSARKRPLPLLPRRVAVVTSASGAALRDVCTVMRRRAPQVGVLVVPTPVQGDGAEGAIIAALKRAQLPPRVDVVLLVRGGGSLEDLWAFQGEALARAIRASRLPVVTGIGHETDTTIADHAADRRAPTPSAAAEVAVPDTRTLTEELARRTERLRRALRQEVAVKRRDLEQRTSRLERVSPLQRLPERRQQLDARVVRLRAALLQGVGAHRRGLDTRTARLRLISPERRLPVEREALLRRRNALESAVRALVERRRARLTAASGRLLALSPRRVMERGYSITLDAESGGVLTSALGLQAGRLLRTLFAEGEAHSRVVEDATRDWTP